MKTYFRILLVATLLLPTATSNAQLANEGIAAAENSTYVVNLRDVEIHVFAEEVSNATGRTLILDPAVNGTVTVLSSQPLDAAGVWELFQSVLRVNGFVAVQAGAGWRVVPQNDAQDGGALFGSGQSSADLVTRLLPLRNLSATDAAGTLQPFMSAPGSIEAFDGPNALVITGYTDDVQRIARLVGQLEGASGGELAVITLQYASAEEVGQLIFQVNGGQDGTGPQVIADPRSNQVLVRGTPEQVAEVRRIALVLDTPNGTSTQTRVIRLSHSDAESITTLLSGLVGAGPTVTNPVAGSLQADTGTRQGLGGLNQLATLQDNPAFGLSAQQDRGVTSGNRTSQSIGFSTEQLAIQAAPEINAIVVRGSPGAIAEVENLVVELDVRRPQVMIEAAIVEITGDAAEQLGVQLGFGNGIPQGGIGAVSFSDQGLSLDRILTVLGEPASVGILEDGLSLGIGFRDEFGILVQALGTASNANLLSTPSLTTLDNSPAEIVVGQNVPFRTGSFATSGNTTDPFTTIQREDVGITLRVLPRIYDGDVVRLEVTQEVSSLVNFSVPGASDLITNRRSIQTTVLADNGGTIALGGLISDDRTEAQSKVPLLGDVPIVGNLFRNTTETATRRTLFVFLRPVILRTQEDVERAANERYERLRASEAESTEEGSLLLNGQNTRLPLDVEGVY